MAILFIKEPIYVSIFIYFSNFTQLKEDFMKIHYRQIIIQKYKKIQRHKINFLKFEDFLKTKKIKIKKNLKIYFLNYQSRSHFHYHHFALPLVD